MATATISKHEMDFTHGSIIKKLIIFAIPLILTNVFQRVFTLTDTIVLGIMVDDKAVGAVGATNTLINLFINFFVGLSAGASVVLSKCLGSGDPEKAKKVVGSSVFLGLFGGLVLGVIGFIGAEQFLIWMKCDPKLLPQAVAYIRIYFIGLPVVLFYNFTSGLLRAVGDTFRPMLYLTIAGVANVGLNIFFIAVFNLTVEGVAIGTVGSQLIASILIFIAIKKSDGYSRFEYKYFKLFKKEVGEIMTIGVPSGIQNSLISVSNVFVQTNVNSFGDQGTIAAAIASQYDAFIYVVGNSVALAGMAFVSQNYGAGNYKRIKESIVKTAIFASICQFIVGFFFYLLIEPLARIMSTDPVVLDYCKTIMFNIGALYFMCGVMETLAFSMRALGKSITAMAIAIIFMVVFRIIWLFAVFPLNPVFEMIYYLYPISWTLSIIAQIILLARILKGIKLKLQK